MSLSQKEIAVRFQSLLLLARSMKPTAIHRPNFKHHNPYYAGDKISLKEGMRESAIETQTKFLKFSMSLKMALQLQYIRNWKCK